MVNSAVCVQLPSWLHKVRICDFGTHVGQSANGGFRERQLKFRENLSNAHGFFASTVQHHCLRRA